MNITSNQDYVFSLTKKADFVELKKASNIYQQLASEGNHSTFDYAFRKFLNDVCPNCGAEGYYRFHTFGSLHHPECNSSWYISPGKYTSIQLKKSFSAGGGFAGGAAYEDEKKGKKQGFFEFILLFLLGLIFRLAFAIISIPIQIILFLFNRQSEDKTEIKSNNGSVNFSQPESEFDSIYIAAKGKKDNEEYYCDSCGVKVKEEDKVCPNCGSEFE